MRNKLMIAIALPILATGFILSPKGCDKANAGTLTGLPCCYESGGDRYSSTYDDNNKCKKPAAWYLCQLIEQAIAGIGELDSPKPLRGLYLYPVTAN